MKKKRFIPCFIIICTLFVFVLCAQSFAAGVTHIHPRETFEIPIGSAEALNASGDAYLTADITLSSDVVISAPMSLCLNGFNINMGSHSITIESTGSLAVYNCPENPGGSFTIGPGDKAAFEVFGEMNVLGGIFNTQGRSVIFNRGMTTISGGSITGADTQLVQSSGSAMLTVGSGEIKATGSGSAIAMIAAPEDETAKKQDYNLAIGGGVITAEAGSPGTVVVNAPKGRLVINTGAKLVGHSCPAVRVEAGSFDAYGGAVVYSDKASAIVGVGGKIGLYFANITSDELYGVDISEDAELLLSGSLEIIGGNAGIRLAPGKVFSMSDYGFYGDVRISIHTDEIPTADKPVAISSPCEAKHYSHFISATPSASITYKDRVIYNTYDGSVSHSHDNRNYVLPFSNSYGDLSKNNFYLESDVSCNGFFTGSVVNICLNGHTLNLGSAIKIYPNSTLNIYDCQGTGKIQCNTTCIQDINNGNAKLVVHQGTIISHSGTPIKLTGGDTVIVKGGSIVSSAEGSCAIDSAGAGNAVIAESGSIEGVASAINLQDGDVRIGGTPEGTFKADCIVMSTGLKPALITVDGNPNCESQTADILLSSGKLLAVGSEIVSDAKFTVACETAGDIITLSEASEEDISGYFESIDETKALMCSEENILQLVRRMPASPESAEINAGDSAQFKVEYTGSGAASYQWYIRYLDQSETKAVKGADKEIFSTPSDLESGNYELYCVVTDETGTFVSDRLRLQVKKDMIEKVSVSAATDLVWTGEPVSPGLNSTASTTFGRSVKFAYSIDGINYSENAPLIGPDAGQYTIYYIASADGCEDVKGQVSVAIEEAELTHKQPASQQTDVSPRLIAIVVSCTIFFVLCVIFTIQLIRKKVK